MQVEQHASVDEPVGPAPVRRPRLAIICPVFNEEQAIPLFFERAAAVAHMLRERYEPRLYFVDNGSADGSQAVIRKLAAEHPGVYLIVLSRNFGYQCALDSGLRVAVGDLYVMIDVDCEDPPELIVRFITEHEQGCDIVYGERLDRPERYYLKQLRKAYYHIVRAVADDNFVLNMAEFSLITAEVRDAVIDESNSFPFIRASIGRLGFRRKGIPYSRQRRSAGQTHYNLIGVVVFGIAGIMSASTVALRWPAYVFAPWLVAMAVLWASAVAKPAAWQIPTMLLLIATFVAFCGVTIALYVARIYKNSLRRPNAIVRWQLSILPDDRGASDPPDYAPVGAWLPPTPGRSEMREPHVRN